MYHPTSRVLTVLELLQARPLLSGPALATLTLEQQTQGVVLSASIDNLDWMARFW